MSANRLKSIDRERARERRQEAFLEILREGHTISEACRRLGIHRTTYDAWRKRHKNFRFKADEVRMGSLRELDSPWQGDFISFRRTYFGMDTYFHQREIVRNIEATKEGEITLVLVPPEFGKTTLLEDYSCFQLGVNPDFRITALSERQQHARKMIGRVQQRMTDLNIAPEYLARFGPFKLPGSDKPWTMDYFRVHKCQVDERDFSMESRGWNGAIAGLRTDLLIPDDIQSRKSLSQTPKMVDVIRQDVFTRARKGRVVFIGTRVGDSDVYETLQDEGVFDHIVNLPAVDAEGHSLCPEMWSDEALAKTREKVGESVWWRNYMQRPQDSSEATFTQAHTDSAFDLGQHAKVARFPDRICSLDPALVNWTGLTVWSYDYDHFQFVDLDRGHNLARTEEILMRVERLAAAYRFQDLVLEGGGMQRGLVNDERLREMGQRYGFRITEHGTGNNKHDVALGVARMPSSFITGNIQFPGASKADRAVVEPLVHELRTWRADVDPRKHRMDLVMSMWFAWLFWQQRRAALNPKREPVKMAGLPFKPLSYPMMRRTA